MKTDYELFRVKGIPVSISLWFLLLLPMVGFSLSIFVSVFIAVLIHELAHALTAQNLGYGAYGINIGLFTPGKNQGYAFELARQFEGENVTTTEGIAGVEYNNNNIKMEKK